MSDNEGKNQLVGKGTRESSLSSSSSSSSTEEKGKKYYISQNLFEKLQDKGFSENAIKKSIVAGCVDESTCTQWITMHEGHPELDTPLDDGVEVVIKIKRVLTEAEREAKVQELREKAKAKKEEEKRLAAEEERKRIEMGKKVLETKEMLDKLRRESELAAVRQQKEEDALARRRVKIQILADKYVRQGIPLEEARHKAEMELEEVARKRREESATLLQEIKTKDTQQGSTSPSTWNLSALAARAAPLSEIFERPTEPPSSIPRLVEGIIKYDDVVISRQCLAVLRTILKNIRDHPFDTTKRSLKTSTNTFSMKLAPVLPALELLRTCGFQLATDNNGNESITATTVVIRVIDRALSLLPESIGA